MTTTKIPDNEVTRMMEHLRQHAETHLKRDGGLTGLIDARTANGESLIIPMMFPNRFAKAMFYASVKQIFKAKNVTHFFLIAEAWGAGGVSQDETAQALDHLQRQSLESFPGRREIVITQFVSYETARTVVYEIYRKDDNSFDHLGEPEVFDGAEKDGEQGSIMELLPGVAPDEQPINFTNHLIH